ncbi:Voltage-dependent calcium channel gamma-3 subunit [Aphelenchoides bicaudatus]|nr:Voltage-dependent calcium channel gamma-3 subunit [Aphelenchoides bicaudatus]
MVLPVIQHRLTKINEQTRKKLIKIALCFSLLGCISNFTSASTNHWLYTSEVLRYFVHPNISRFDDLMLSPRYFKNATLGPWFFCWLDPITPYHCNKVDVFSQEEPSDVTSSIEYSVRPSFFFFFAGCFLDLLGFIGVVISYFRSKPYQSLFHATILHIFAGIADFNSIIVYMSGVSKEVGNKIFPATEMDDPLFYYSYGFSFIVVKISFLCTETAAFLLVLVYMSKRDERTFNHYCISNVLKNVREEPSAYIDQMVLNQTYYDHSRMNCLKRASRLQMHLLSNLTQRLHHLIIKGGEHFADDAEPFDVDLMLPNVAPGLNAQWTASYLCYKRQSTLIPFYALNIDVSVQHAHLVVNCKCLPFSIRVPLVSIGYVESDERKLKLDIRGQNFRLVMWQVNAETVAEVREWLRFLILRQRIPHSILGLPFEWQLHQCKNRPAPKLKFTWNQPKVVRVEHLSLDDDLD